mmetsp:Transcript_31947/g.31209  ORF Transcript_31947/g.31209 Transcript_31947/m.31209 type:complete len:85 (+) Transcript_31947:782-1036(+)
MWFGLVTILCGLMMVMLSLFFFYHLFMSLGNATTNERAKRSEMKHFYKNKLEFLKEWQQNFENKDYAPDPDLLKYFSLVKEMKL